ncbi:IS1096 element passenger TnpR family protein [Frigoriflavimonas asaccharolytica]|uniref:Plasmid pRiA4b Orf3-like domain-containing protein n=1 Tax=Frigoriflavimonas asaccharolytica TaxID=2735899 RepID=A0A8J8KC01_9FLAO|nr:hypothetical protein [Frigoriflavimonas asaccharolytica]NRS93094.1 hypothetical protein [Frigoriflavimonas asaccharolytica]
MVFKIRIILDSKEDVFRDVEIKGKQTLWNLHNGIKSAFSLSGEELSTFNLLEPDGTIVKSVPLEDMSDEGDGEIMSDIYISEAFENVGDKAQFQYGFIDLWEFFCELIEIKDDKNGINYPITIYRFGSVPMKAPGKPAAGKKKPSIIAIDDDFGMDEFTDGYDDEEDDFDDEEDFADDFPEEEI